MRIIARRTLREFATRHPQARPPLDDWYNLVVHATWQTPSDVKRVFASADFLADNRAIFNIGGNRYRLVVKIEYRFQTVYIRFVGAHRDYDQIDPRTI